MDFSFETLYGYRALSAVARATRKVYRRKNSLFMRIFGLLVVAFGVYKSTPLSGHEFNFSVRGMISYAALIVIFLTVFLEDLVNGMIARKRLPRGEFLVDAQFSEDSFTVITQTEKTAWLYQRVKHLAETKHYFIFLFSEHNAEIFEKDTLTGISEGEFRQFIAKKTGKDFHKV